ncbi:MAG: class I SAM-dependent methyltransferase [Candidatus Brocadia sp.]|nr:class I SAM-dependent methyltransferase [Candidatus Brocadia sp.]
MGYREKIYKYYSSNRIGKLAPDTVTGFKPREPYLRKIIKEHFPADKHAKILEIGCGHGAFQYYITQSGYLNSIGIDRSEEQIKEAYRLGIRNVVYADLVSYIKAVKNNSVDLLIAFDVIEHFSKDELSDLVDDFYRVLKTGGKIISHQPNGESPFGNFVKTGDFTHEIAFTRQSIAQLFLSSSFKEVTSYEDKPIPHGLKSLMRFVLWEYFVRNFYRLLIGIETGDCDRNAIFSQNFLTVAYK